MARLDFFAVRTDALALLQFIFAETDIRVFEHASRDDCDLREFAGAGEIDAAFSLGHDARGNGLSPALSLWSPSVMPAFQVRRIEYDRRHVPDARFRFEPAGGGLMQLYLGGAKERVITKSHFGHFSVAGAAKWGLDGGIDWDRAKKLSNRIQYHLRSRLAASKVKGRPVLAAAFQMAREGYALKEAYQTPWRYDLDS
jgi:hypothetical protein